MLNFEATGVTYLWEQPHRCSWKEKGCQLIKGQTDCMAGLESRLSAFLTVQLASLKPLAPGRRKAIKGTSGSHSHSPTQGWSKKRLWAWNRSSAGIRGEHGSWTLIFLISRGMSRDGLPKHHLKAQKSTSQALTLSLAWSHRVNWLCVSVTNGMWCRAWQGTVFTGGASDLLWRHWSGGGIANGLS